MAPTSRGHPAVAAGVAPPPASRLLLAGGLGLRGLGRDRGAGPRHRRPQRRVPRGRARGAGARPGAPPRRDRAVGSCLAARGLSRPVDRRRGPDASLVGPLAEGRAGARRRRRAHALALHRRAVRLDRVPGRAARALVAHRPVAAGPPDRAAPRALPPGRRGCRSRLARRGGGRCRRRGLVHLGRPAGRGALRPVLVRLRLSAAGRAGRPARRRRALAALHVGAPRAARARRRSRARAALAVRRPARRTGGGPPGGRGPGRPVCAHRPGRAQSDPA
jgi:hypothetical protein